MDGSSPSVLFFEIDKSINVYVLKDKRMEGYPRHKMSDLTIPVNFSLIFLTFIIYINFKLKIKVHRLK